MGRGLSAYKIDIPESRPLPVNDSRAPSNLHIIASTGQYADHRPDGSIVIGSITGKQRDTASDKFDANLAEDLAVPLDTICSMLLEGIDADLKSRAEWEETANIGRALLGVKLEPAGSSVGSEGTVAKVKHLGYLEAVIRSWANSRAELLPAGGPVKVTDDLPAISEATPSPNDPASAIAGAQPNPAEPPPDPNAKPPTRSQLADALESDMNHYLTVVDKEYVPNFSQMLLNRAIEGVAFRKVYHCPIRRRPTSTWVRGADLIVSNDTSHLAGAGRVTERIRMRQATVKRLQAMGHWRQISLAMPTQVPSSTDRSIEEQSGQRSVPQLPADQRHEIYECYVELDDGPLADDETGKTPGFPLPYRVTIEKDSRAVLEIRRNWKQGDPDYTARRRYVKYGFVPGFGFYDWGLVHILGNPQRAASAIECILIDTGMMNSYPGGLMSKGPGTRQRNNNLRPAPGEFAVVDTGGLKIGDVVMPLPYKEPSNVLQSVGQTIAGDMRRIAGVMEVPVGEGRVGNVPVATMMSYVDAITKVPSAIHKDDHATQAEEFELLRELFMEDPGALTRGVKRPKRKDYTTQELNDQELVPRADPNVASHVHRMMQTTALVEAAAMQIFQGVANPRGLWARVCRALGADDEAEITAPPQPAAPPPDPRIVAAQIKAGADTAKTNADLQKTQSADDLKATELAIKQETDTQDRASEERRAGMHLAGEALKAHAKVGTDVLGTAQEHAQHLNEMGQADRHKAADLANTPPPADSAGNESGAS